MKVEIWSKMDLEKMFDPKTVYSRYTTLWRYDEQTNLGRVQ